MNSTQRWSRFLSFSGSFGLWLLCGSIPSAIAQIRPDTTLSTPSAITSTPNRTVIRGGTQRGTNLFHSFQQFSIPTNGTAAFLVDRSVANIFSRVTGSSISRIDGRLQVLRSDDNSLSSANFFLLNPNGILFGRNASLNVGGSFLATTADRIDFADGTQFSATVPQANPLLTIQVPTGLQFGDRPGDIVNRSIALGFDIQDKPQNDYRGFPLQGLSVSAGRTLALIGGDIFVPDGIMSAEGGRIELGSLAQRGRVGLDSLTEGWALRYNRRQSFGDIRLRLARLDTSGAAGGAMQLQGRQIRLNNATEIGSTTVGSQLGRLLIISATDSVVIRDGSTLQTRTEGDGTAGNIRLSTRQLTVQNGGVISSLTAGAGQGGTVRIDASDSITVEGETTGNILASLATKTTGQKIGAAGNIEIQTDRLQVLPGGQIGSTTSGRGNTGDIRIQATEVNLTGTVPSDFNGIPVEASSGIFAGTNPASRGNGGTINIQSQQLNLSDGALVQASTYGSGDAGNVEIHASEIDVAGTSESGQRSGILATSGGLPNASFFVNRRSATGRGGNISITTNTLRIRDRAVVAVNSLNPAAPGAGTLQIQAQLASLDNHAQLNAETESAGANITLPQLGVLLLRRQSGIFTTAGNSSGSGMGGNIRVDGHFVIAAASENSDIIANARDQNAGNVTLNANVVGISPQSRLTSQSDITATSERGVSGAITISQPQTDPTRSLVELPGAVVDASGLIAQRCSTQNSLAHSRNQSLDRPFDSFVITGRGGLPLSPADAHGSDVSLAPWATLDPEAHNMQPSSQSVEQTTPIREAQGWITNAAGKVELVTQMPALTKVSTDGVSTGEVSTGGVSSGDCVQP
jgi:filamentous hemagglutinin family protein